MAGANRAVAKRTDNTIYNPSRILKFLALTIGLSSFTTVYAGGGPENVFLVVNDRSWASRTVANHYIELRDIPTVNIFYLSWSGSVERTSIGDFREQILKPIIATIEKRGLVDQIDHIVYSSDFPYEIDYTEELPRGGKFSSGSITGLTFLYKHVLDMRMGEVGGITNWYANTSTDLNSTVGFESAREWKSPIRAASSQGRKYFLSTMLGYTSGRGNSVSAIARYLERSAKADGSFPDGTVYFMKNEDVRSKTRSNYFEAVADAIRQQGGKAEILAGNVPQGKEDILGAVLGRANTPWNGSGSKILPGGICENLTSFGGVLRASAAQTPLTVYLKLGSAGSSGTVIEPYAILSKFPHPTLHLHYRRGATLAEAYYLSVKSPYQLLVVGDPLCQPFARQPVVQVEGISASASVKGKVNIKPSLATSGASPVLEYQIFVDGRLRKRINSGASYEFDSSRMPDGYHELRVVAVMNDPLRTRGRRIIPFTVDNRGHKITTRMMTPKLASWDGNISVNINSPDSHTLAVFHNHRTVANDKGPRRSVSFSSRILGLGPTQLLVAGLGDSNLDNVFGPPLKVDVGPGRTLRARPVPIGTASQGGVLAIRPDGTGFSVSKTERNWLQKAKIKQGEPFQVGALFTVKRTGIFQFQTYMNGDLQLAVDNVPVFNLTNRNQYQRYETPIHLEKGTHEFRARAKTGRRHQLDLSFGFDGTYPLAGPRFKHGA